MIQLFPLCGEGAEGERLSSQVTLLPQNGVIDIDCEVILVDTILPAEFPDAAADQDAQNVTHND